MIHSGREQEPGAGTPRPDPPAAAGRERQPHAAAGSYAPPGADISRRVHPVGRAHELSTLRGLLRSAADGHGALAIIGGEAGVGKTTLIQWLIQEAGDDVDALHGHCYDLEVTAPYGPWIDMLREGGTAENHPAPPPALTATDGPPGLLSPYELWPQVWEFLADRATIHPLVLVLEDLQWSDRVSLEMLCYVGRQLAAHPILIVVTYRDVELTPRHPLYQLLPSLVREAGATRISLRRLGREAIRELVHSRYELEPGDSDRLADYLLRYAEGNPFFIGELLTTLENARILDLTPAGWSLGELADLPVPPLVQQVIDSRLERLTPEARDALQVAAVLGEEFSIDLWQAITQTSDDTLADVLEQALDARMLAEIPHRSALRFQHALVRRALYERMTLLQRRSWHRRVGEALSGQSSIDDGLVSFHFGQANDPRAIEWHVRAGDRAYRLYAPDTAVEHCSSAIEMARARGMAPSAHVLHRRGQAYATIGSFDLGREDLEAALAIARSGPDRERAWETLIDLGLLWGERDYARSGGYLREALDLAREHGDPRMVATSLDWLGDWYLNVEELDRGLDSCREALAIHEQLDDPVGIATSHNLLARGTAFQGDLFASERYNRTALDAFRRLGDRLGETQALSRLTFCAMLSVSDPLVPLGVSLAESQQAGESALRIAREIGWRTGEAYIQCFLAALYIPYGRPGAATTCARAGLDLARDIEHRQGEALATNVHARIFFDLLQLRQACDYGERALRLAREISSMILTYQSSAYLALSLIGTGDLDRAEQVLDSTFPADRRPASAGQYFCHSVRAALLLRAGAASQALELTDRLQSLIPGWTPQTISPRLAYLRGQILRALERHDEALHELTLARAVAASLGARGLQWRIDVELARVQHARGNVAAMQQAGSDAEAAVRLIAAEVDDPQTRADFERQALLQLPRSGQPMGESKAAAMLSARERDVLRLVAQGMTDAEIAGQLAISSRTVSSHLQSIYNKLGVSSRTAATILAYQHGIV
jgi:DNA-binding CsgD family transcriptional regulator/tetratricopeptide (TPR) repeat protein